MTKNKLKFHLVMYTEKGTRIEIRGPGDKQTIKDLIRITKESDERLIAAQKSRGPLGDPDYRHKQHSTVKKTKQNP